MILVFDLDDTLYDEFTYVRSSFYAVARYISNQNKKLSADIVLRDMMEILDAEGRGSVFDDVLTSYGMYSHKEVRKCLSIYRHNIPEIELSPAAVRCLKRFHDYPKYVVTDGNKQVQWIKIKALKIENYVKKAYPTHRYGIIHAKPSTYCFHKILKLENSKPKDLVYIGDNPKKDFVNLKKEGFKTIRVLTGWYKDLRLDDEFEADFEIQSLDELDESFLGKLKN